MAEIKQVDLEDVLMDLEGVCSLLTVLAGSGYYRGTAEEGVCRALRNSISCTGKKLEELLHQGRT